MRYFKHLIFTAASFGFITAAAHAERPYGAAGCGLGAIIFKPTGSQTSAATSNGSFYSQTFGISFGTSKCIPKDKMAKLLDQEKFVSANYASLSKEVAQGSGTTLAALSQKLGCDQAMFPELALHLKGSYAELFKAPGAIAMLHKTMDSINNNPRLARGCNATTF